MRYGHEAVVIALVQEFKAIPDVVDKMGATARAYAVEVPCYDGCPAMLLRYPGALHAVEVPCSVSAMAYDDLQ